MRNFYTKLPAALLLALAMHGPAGAQALQPQPQPLDQSVEDRDPLSNRGRTMPWDLRQPVGFQNVYHVPGRADMLMRINGGVYAIFPQSVYAEGKHGLVPLVPAGTIFYIGQPPQITPRGGSSGGPAGSVNPTRVRSRIQRMVDSSLPSDAPLQLAVGTRANTAAYTTPPPPEEQMPRRSELGDQQARISRPDPGILTGPTIVNDPQYRVQRMNELLHRACQAYAERFKVAP